MANSSITVKNLSNVDEIQRTDEVAKKMWINFESDYTERIHDVLDKKDN